MGKFRLSVFFIALFVIFAAPTPTFSRSLGADYLCELGVSLYKLGRYNDALTEFSKVLLVEPNHRKAKKFISKIYKRELSRDRAKKRLKAKQAKKGNRK